LLVPNALHLVLIAGLFGPSLANGQPDSSRAAERREMVDSQIAARGIRDRRVLDAMLEVPRHLFVPEPWRARAYLDTPLPIGFEQTISQPYIVAFMTEALQIRPGDQVLEIGTGSGYQAAVLGKLAKQVYTIEIIPELARRAEATLASLGLVNVEVRTGNGYLGWPEHAPFDRIMVTAAPDQVPPALVDQLRIGGLMAIPVGTAAAQELRILRRTTQKFEILRTLPVRFVPMVAKPPRVRIGANRSSLDLNRQQ
jgi:protein-L-isoaspartate(D-aspartate) O-methyltransferase